MRNWLAVILSFPAVILDESVEFVKRVFRDEKDVADGAEENDD